LWNTAVTISPEYIVHVLPIIPIFKFVDSHKHVQFRNLSISSEDNIFNLISLSLFYPRPPYKKTPYK
jgi:hypothetical protein